MKAADGLPLGEGDAETDGLGETDTLAEADGDGLALFEGEGDGDGFGVEVFVGVGVGVGFGAVMVKVADAENPVFLSVNETVTRWVPSPRCPEGGRKPDFVATQLEPKEKAADPSETPSHRNVAFVG